MHSKVSSVKWRPFYLGFNVLNAERASGVQVHLRHQNRKYIGGECPTSAPMEASVLLNWLNWKREPPSYKGCYQALMNRINSSIRIRMSLFFEVCVVWKMVAIKSQRQCVKYPPTSMQQCVASGKSKSITTGSRGFCACRRSNRVDGRKSFAVGHRHNEYTKRSRSTGGKRWKWTKRADKLSIKLDILICCIWSMWAVTLSNRD